LLFYITVNIKTVL